MEHAGYGLSFAKKDKRDWRRNPRRFYGAAKRIGDIVGSSVGLLALGVPMLIVYAAVRCESPGGGLFRQWRVGRFGMPFMMYKFRTMFCNAGGPPLTVRHDARVTRLGRFLRWKKWDEWPQLWNILRGDMSFVGPRPEVARYVAHYSEEQRVLLNVRPGLTDPASLAFFHEEDVLAQNAQDSELVYIREILPMKNRLSRDCMDRQSLAYDLYLICKTLIQK